MSFIQLPQGNQWLAREKTSEFPFFFHTKEGENMMDQEQNSYHKKSNSYPRILKLTKWGLKDVHSFSFIMRNHKLP
jgi:hypothetical protein